jgi:membrane-bound serine protease (ClpP class)
VNKKTLLKVFIFLAILTGAGMRLSRAGTDIFIFNIDSTINPVVADYIENGLEYARDKEAAAVIIKMDTPGGLMDSMRQIIKAMEAAPYPVIVYIGPAGARAASAGAFITMASDIAVMAKGTNIGAAHPVQLGDQKTTEDISKKMAEDARAFMKSLAKKHNRNAEWAQKAVTESVSITSTEAVELNVVEYEVKDFNEMLSMLEGKVITKDSGKYTLGFKNIRIVEMAFFKKFLNYIAHPNFAYILLMLGIYGLIYEFSNPGIGLGAVVGGVSLLLAALAFQMIPINTVGILLIIFGALLMFTDVFVPSYGILTIGGVISFLMGSLTLFDVERFDINVSLGLILGATVTTALFFIFAAGSGIKIQRKKVTTGIKGMIGLEGEVKIKLAPKGEIFIRGEMWAAQSPDGEIEEGAAVEVIEVKGNLLVVKKK